MIKKGDSEAGGRISEEPPLWLWSVLASRPLTQQDHIDIENRPQIKNTTFQFNKVEIPFFPVGSHSATWYLQQFNHILFWDQILATEWKSANE